MSSVPRWRRESAPGGRSRLVGVLLAGLAILLGVLVLVLPYLRPPARCRLVPLCIASYDDPTLQPPPWRIQDSAALAEGNFFTATQPPPPRLDRAAVERELADFATQRDNLVVYLAGLARLDASGRIHLLCADADLDDPGTWLPLERVLQLLRQGRAAHRLLLLDLDTPAEAARGIVLDDLASALPAVLDAVPDRGRLVLFSRGAGQTAWASEVMGRSAFGHYVEEALRGIADASGDGRVSARELAAFVRARVDRWARTVRAARQTPVLFGEGDFTLVDLPTGTAAPEPPEEIAYPEGLLSAWKKATGPAARRAALAAEHAWRGGADEERVAALLRKGGGTLPPPAGPPVRSLARAVGGTAPPDALVDALRQLVFQAEARARALPPAKATEVRDQLVADFLKGFKEAPAVQLAWAALAVAGADARPEALRLLDLVVRALEPQPRHVETLILRLLAEKDLPRPIARRALEVVRAIETACSRPRTFGLDEPGIRKAAQLGHEGLVVLEATGYAPLARADELLRAAHAEADGLLARQETAQEAVQAVDEARDLLPALLAWVEREGQGEGAWLQAAALARELDDRLRRAGDRPDELRRQAELLRTRLTELKAPFGVEGREELIRASRQGSAGGVQWRRLDAVLATPLLQAEDRVAVWKAARELSARLEDEVQRQDRRDGTRVRDVTEPGGDGGAAALARARRALALVGLQELPGERRRRLQEILPATPDTLQLARFEVALRRAWKDAEPYRPDNRLWAFLADRFRYEARESSQLGPEAAALFYRQAADDYRPWLSRARDDYVEVSEANNPPRLLPARPIVKQIEVRPVTAPGEEKSLRLDVLSPDDGTWLDVRPRSLALPVQLGPGRERGYLVPLTLTLAPTAGRGNVPMPKGLLVQVRQGERAYHRRIDIPLAPRGPQILLSASDKSATPALAALRLRPGVGRQTFYLHLGNPLSKPWNKLVVRLRNGGDERVSKPIRLEGLAVQPVTFPPPTMTITPVPTAPGAAVAVPLLPRLEGPIRITVEDQEDRNRVVASRELVAEITRPQEYVSLTAVRFDPAGGKDRLEVRLRQRQTIPLPPVEVGLAFPAAGDGGLTAGKGTLQGKLPPARDEVLLFAEGVRAPGEAGEGRFGVNVDGWARAFSFRATLAERGRASTPVLLDAPAIRLRVGAYGLAGPTFAVPLEVDNAPLRSSIEVSLGRLEGGAFLAEATARRPTPRERIVRFSPLGTEGALAFEAAWLDWTLPLDTSRIRGPRELRARLLDSAGRQLAMASRGITLGDRPPAEVAFIDPPARAWRLAPLPLRARGGDGVVGVKEVFFFVGKPAGDKVPENARREAGVPVDATRQVWAVKLPLPRDRAGPTDVSVQFVNQVGLSTFATTTVDLLENDPNLARTGTIKGKVLEGERGQEGLTVVLTDPRGAEKGRTKSGDGGAYEFKDLAPGKYRVTAAKVSSGRAGTAPRDRRGFLDVAAGATVTADVALFLRGR